LLRSESDSNVVDLVVPHLHDVRRFLSEPDQKTYDQWLPKQLPISERAASDEGKQLEALLFAARAEAGDPATLQQAQELTAKFLEDPHSIEPTLASAALRASAQYGSKQLYDRIEAKWKSAETPELSFRYLNLLAEFRDPQLIDRSLALLLSPEMREQDVPFFLSGLLHNPLARDKAWQTLRDRWDALKGKIVGFGGSGPVLALGEYCSQDKAKEVRSFFDDHPLPGAERSVKSALEQINECTALKKSQAAKLSQWLATATN
jgi:aminopeptidase N